MVDLARMFLILIGLPLKVDNTRRSLKKLLPSNSRARLLPTSDVIFVSKNKINKNANFLDSFCQTAIADLTITATPGSTRVIIKHSSGFPM